MLIILVVLVAVIILVITSIRRRRAAERAALDGSAAQVPTFRVVALGVSGAGKTVFLSSMFHELNYRTPHRSYYLDIDPDQRFQLNAVYQKVADPKDAWPRATSTGETKKYQFRCVGWDREGTKRTVMQLEYLDFSGGLLEGRGEPGGAALTQLLTAIDEASALLVLLDGRRVRQLLMDEPEGRDHFQRTIRPVVGFAQNAACPIHFVVTKWDLVQTMPAMRQLEEAGRLSTVVAALFQFAHLKALVYEHSRRQVVRIIPVSSVGPDFVRVDESGRSAKRPDGTLHPTNVEAPISAIVPDLFRQIEANLDPRTKQIVVQELSSRMRAGAAEFIGGLAASLRPVLARLTPVFDAAVGPLGGTAYLLFADWLATSHDTRAEHVQAAEGRAAQEVGVVRDIRNRVLEDFTRAVYRLEDRYPTSLLSER